MTNLNVQMKTIGRLQTPASLIFLLLFRTCQLLELMVEQRPNSSPVWSPADGSPLLPGRAGCVWRGYHGMMAAGVIRWCQSNPDIMRHRRPGGRARNWEKYTHRPAPLPPCHKLVALKNFLKEDQSPSQTNRVFQLAIFINKLLA